MPPLRPLTALGAAAVLAIIGFHAAGWSGLLGAAATGIVAESSARIAWNTLRRSAGPVSMIVLPMLLCALSLLLGVSQRWRQAWWQTPVLTLGISLLAWRAVYVERDGWPGASRWSRRPDGSEPRTGRR